MFARVFVQELISQKHYIVITGEKSEMPPTINISKGPVSKN